MEDKKLFGEEMKEFTPEELSKVTGGDSYRVDYGPALEPGTKLIKRDDMVRVEVLSVIGHDPLYGYEYLCNRYCYVDIPGIIQEWMDLGYYKCTDSIIRNWEPDQW